MSKKRKLNDKNDQPNKRQKIDNKSVNNSKTNDDYFNSEDSRSDEEFHEYQISDLLVPQERLILRKDPYHNNIFADVYSNDITLQKKRNQALSLDPNPDLALPTDVIANIVRYCDSITICNMSIAAKSFSSSSLFWKNLFIGQRWRLPHELKNFYFNRDHKRYNVDIKYNIDWFEECQRNCFNANRIQELINEISVKIYGIMDEYGVKWHDENNKSLFNPGLSDSELDEWERKNNYLLTNDMRQLYKCCNGTRFRMVDLEGERLSIDWWLEVPNFMLPKLDDITVSNEFSLKSLDRAVERRFFDEQEHSSDDDVNDNLFCEVDPQIYGDALRQRKPSITLKDLENYADDSNSDDSSGDKDEHITKDQEQQKDDSYSDISEHSSENSSDEEYQKIGLNDDGLNILLNLGQCRDQSNPDDPWTDEAGTYELMYEPIMGYVFTIKRVEPSGRVRFTSNYRSIVEWLQEISDHLEDPRAHYWILSKSSDPSEFNILEKHYEVHHTLDDDLGDYWEKFPWARLCAENLQDFTSPREYGDDRQFYMPPRCDKMIAAAAQDFMVKVFSRANQLETADHLRAETLAIAATELGLERSHQWYKIRYERSPESFEEVGVIDL